MKVHEYVIEELNDLSRGMEEFASRGAKWFVLLTQYCAGDKIETNEMGWVCGTYG